MKKTVNLSHVRTVNQRAILDAIFQNGESSKAQLARMLDMSKPSMADNVAALLQIGIIKEMGEGACSSGGGRKPTLLRFCDDFKYIIVMDFQYQHSYFCLSDLRGTIINQFTIQQTPTADLNSWITMCINAVSMLMASQGITHQDLATIAVSAPGILNDSDKNYIVSSKYGDFNVGQMEEQLSAAFPVPVLIKNSTNASVLGEWCCGGGQDKRHLAFISCGQGVGAGILLNGRLYEGSHLAAGEIGFSITPETLNSKNASLENRICIDSVLKQLNDGRQDPPLTFPDMIRQYQTSDPEIIGMVDLISTELGCAVCNLLSVIDCELVIIGGDYLAFEERLIPGIQKIVDSHAAIPVPVIPSRLGEKASVLGLIATSREFYFKQICTRSAGDEQ
ncbi:MAG: ROK family transcriptional regulator [Lacrimispora sp.]|uniref:ROK family transcriptional regulator n=1 Tax=Lacrimispora sp. TaxID=2719234 RepID=UPI0039E7127D